MANASFTLTGKINVTEIMNGIQQLKSSLSKEDLGAELFKSLTSELNALEGKFKKTFSNIPGVNASSKSVNTFKNNVLTLLEELSSIKGQAKGFEVTDDYIQENIESVKKLLEEYEELSKKTKDVQKEIRSSKLTTVEGTRSKKTVEDAGISMRRIALDKETSKEDKQSQLQQVYQSTVSALQNKASDSNATDAQKNAITQQLQELKKYYEEVSQAIEEYHNLLSQGTQKEGELTEATKEATTSFEQNRTQFVQNAEQQQESLRKVGEQAEQTGENLSQMEAKSRTMDQITSRLKQMFSVSSIFMIIRRLIHGVIEDFKELDKQFNEIAIVSQYSTKEMWNSFSSVNAMAQEYGVTTKNILEVQNLYYHQGKEMAEVNKLTAQTLTLAKITGMDYAEATNKMTAALNAYKLSAEDASRVTDTVAALSANAATSSEELMTALTKTASIAANAGVSLENTEVFLTKMIETTREAPENLGTALKTIVARFGEVKQEIDGEMVETADINKVDKALKSVGMTLLDSAGQVRDLDQVFMELSSKWDSLDRNTQRYIATQAAGSRQQSRFIAMMENYDRTLELTEVAQDAAGTGARQLAKAQESIETHLNRLKSAWQEFYSGIIKSGMIKFFIDLGNKIVGVLNKISKIKVVGPYFAVIVAGMTAWGAKILLVDRLYKKLNSTILANIGVNKAENTTLRSKIKSAMEVIAARKAETKSLVSSQVASKSYMSAILQEAGVEATQADVIAASAAAKMAAVEGEETLQASKALTIALLESEIDAQVKEDAVLALETEGKLANAAANKLDALSEQQGIRAKITAWATSKAMTNAKVAESAAKLFDINVNEGESISFWQLAAAEMAAYWPLLLIIAAIAAVIAVGVALYNMWAKENKIMSDTSEQLDALAEKKQAYNEQVKKTQDLENNIKLLEKYNDTLILSTEQQEEYNDAINQIAEDYPSLIDYIDEEGNYHLKNIAILEKEIETQKKLNKEKRDEYIKYQGQLAHQGIFGEDSNISQKYELGMQAAAAEVAPSDSIEDQAKELRKKVGLTWDQSGQYKSWQSLIEKTLSGEYNGGMTKQQLNDILSYSYDDYGTYNSKMTEEQYQAFLKAMSGQEFNEESILKALDEAGYTGGTQSGKEAFAKRFTEINEGLGGAFEVVTQQWNEAASSQKQSLLLSLDDIDFEFETSTDINAKLAEAIAQALPDITDEQFQQYMSGLTEEKYKKISSILNTDEIQLSDLGISAIADFDDVTSNIADYLQKEGISEDDPFYQAYYQMLEKAFTLTDEEKSTLSNVIGADFTQLGDITKTQLNAMLKTAGALTENYETQDKAKAAYQEMNKILQTSTKESGKYSQALNSLNKNNLTTTQGIRQFGKDMKNSGVSIKDAIHMVDIYNNGLDNLELETPTQLLEDLAQSTEDFNKQLEAMGRLKEGKGTLEDLGIMVEALTQGLEGAELLNTISNIDKAITATADGLLVDMSIVGQAGEALLNEQITGNDFLMKVYQGVEQGALEAAKTAALGVQGLDETTRAAIQTALSIDELLKLVDGLPGVKEQLKNNEEWSKAINRSAQARINQTLLKYNSGMNKAASAASKAGDSAKDAADNAKKAWEEFAKWLRDFDEYANLDKIIEFFDEELGHLEYELKFTTNEKLVEKDIKKQINLINNQIAANQGGARAAQQNLQMWREVLERRNSGYVNFDVDGNALVNAEKLRELQEQIRDTQVRGDEAATEALKAQYDEIMANVEAYDKEKKKVEEYTKAVESSVDKLQEALNETYEKIISLEDKLIEVIQAREDKELEAVKTKYEKIKEENDKYLEDVRKMVDKEREIRDRAQNEESIKLKERRLAMLQMSGGSQAEILALQKELQQDYQDLSDANVDRYLNEKEEENTVLAETMDKETAFIEGVLESRRETMQYYIDLATQMITQGSDYVINYLMENDQEYLTASETKKKEWTQSTNDLVAQGVGAYRALADDGIETVRTALNNAKETMESFSDAMDIYANQVEVKNGSIKGSINDLSKAYQDMVKGAINSANDLINTLEEVERRAKAAADAARDAANTYNNFKDTDRYTVTPKQNNDPYFYRNSGNGVMVGTKQPGANETFTKTGKTVLGTNGANDKPQAYIEVKDSKGNTYWITKEDANSVLGTKGTAGTGNSTKPNSTNTGNRIAPALKPNGKQDYFNDWNHYYEWHGTGRILDYQGETYVELEYKGLKRWALKRDTMYHHDDKITHVGTGSPMYYEYASGGMVDYTGPAWVDGTKTKPEAFLSASDTANIAALRDTLAYIYSQPTITNGTSTSSVSNATYNITVQVDSISNDYDVDRAITRIEDQISKASKYRNINIVKKSN